MDARCESQCSVCEECVDRSDDFLSLDRYSDEQLATRIGQARMRIEDEQLILEACRQMLQQRGAPCEYDA
jgi:hypothetical protein